VDPSTEKYVSFTTFKRDGTPVATPVWCTPLGEATFGFWTSSESGKAKRLAHTERVLVQPSDARGRVKAGTSPEEGTAKLVTGAEYDTIKHQIEAKYGFFTKLTKFFNGVGNAFRRGKRPYGDRGVVVTLGAPSAS
jgi:PPOX class probable F420-dependent enzyme